jgi:hypothetical protein
VDSLHAGCSFFFVAQVQPEGLVERGALGSVGSAEQFDHAAGLSENSAYIVLGEGCWALVRALPLLDRGSHVGQLGLNLARLAGRERRVHPRSNGGEDAVELHVELALPAARLADLGRLDIGLPICGENGGDCRVEVVAWAVREPDLRFSSWN